MKKIVLFSLALITCFSVLSQIRLTSTYDIILNDLKEQKKEIIVGVENERLYIYTEQQTSYTLYFFNNNRICNTILVEPKTTEILNKMVEKYNKEYICVSDTKWKVHAPIGTVDIELIFSEDVYYFMWMIR